ncbi:MAG: phosphatidylglycerol lysyltransferase domain-containing protein, partial [Lachnospiraceae bacterium]|nr:phosphatidylglycerol lysyltransferase domain-containing protein [Lachnospiraceae bacterium]
VFLSEGYEWASLGNAPLAGLAEDAPQTGNASKKKTSEEKGKNSDGNSARQEADKKDQQMNARKESEGAETTAGPQQNAVEKMLRFVYEKLNACYGFKDLYRAKEKYNPYEWLPEYYVFLPKIPTPQMFYAVVRIQNPGGLGSYAKDILESFAHKKVDRRR